MRTATTNDTESRSGRRSRPAPGIVWLAVAELVVGVGALALMRETNPLYYLLVIAVALVVVGLVAYDQRRRVAADAAALERRAAVARAADELLAAAGAPVADPLTGDADAAAPAPVTLRSTREEFVAALVEYGMGIGVRTVTRDDAVLWAEARNVEYELLRVAQCCAENDQGVVGELVTWDSVSVLHLLDTTAEVGHGVARSIVAPYGRLPAATRVPVRRDPARFTCEVATLALDPRVANELALHLLWRGIYDHARRGGATDVVWTLAPDLAALWRDHFGFPVQTLGDTRRAGAPNAVTISVPLPDLEAKLLREQPAYYGWLTVGMADAERAALGLPVDLTAAYDRVCSYVLANRSAEVRSPLVPQ